VATTVQPFTETYEIDRLHSTLQFAVGHLTVSTFRASFTGVTGSLSVEDGELVLQGDALADSVSIEAPEFREHVVRGADFFDADAHPSLTFRSDSVELREDGSARVSGELVIRGVSRPVAATGTYRPPVVDPFGTERAGLELSTVVDRRSWELNWQAPLPDGGDALGWEVEITAHLELTKAA